MWFGLAVDERQNLFAQARSHSATPARDEHELVVERRLIPGIAGSRCKGQRRMVREFGEGAFLDFAKLVFGPAEEQFLNPVEGQALCLEQPDGDQLQPMLFAKALAGA